MLVNDVLCFGPGDYHQIKPREIQNRCNISTKTWDIGWVLSDGLASRKWTSHHSVKTHLTAIISHREAGLLISAASVVLLLLEEYIFRLYHITSRVESLGKISVNSVLPFWFFSRFQHFFAFLHSINSQNSSHGLKNNSNSAVEQKKTHKQHGIHWW